MAGFQQLQVGGGAANIGTSYNNTNQLFGYNAFNAPLPAQTPQQQQQQYQGYKPGMNTGTGTQNRGSYFKVDPSQYGGITSATGTAYDVLGHLRGQGASGDVWYNPTLGQVQIGGNETGGGVMTAARFSGQQQPQKPNWADAYKGDMGLKSGRGVESPMPTSPTNPAANDLSYIQLANMLDAGSYAKRGLSEQDVVNAMANIKRSA